MSKNEALETSAQSEEKPKQRKSKAKETFSVTLEDGSVIDLDSFDYGETKLTQKEKLFILWYTYPASSSYHDSAKSARKAGYSQKNARMSGYNLRHNPKIARSEFQGLDFYNIENHIAENGKIHTSVTIKKPEELTEEQKLCIDGLEFVGQHSIPNYKLPNRTAEENKLIELYEKINGEGNKEGYEVETTAEIIKGNLQVKTRVVKANSEITELSELRNKTEERTEED